MKTRIPAFVLLLLTIGASGADYLQPPALQHHFPSDPRSPTQNPAALIADDFQLSADTSVGVIRWWGAYNNKMPGQFELAIWADDGVKPGALISELRISSLAELETGRRVATSYPEFFYTAMLETPFLAQAGVHYWLSIGNATLIPGNWGWEDASSSIYPGYAFRDAEGIWKRRTDIVFDMAFSVPEPNPLYLAVTSLVMAGLVRLIWRRN